MTDRDQGIEGRFARLAAATAALEPSSGFESRVMAAVGAESERAVPSATGDWLMGVMRSGRFALAAAAAVAGLAMFSAVRSAQAFDEEAAVAYAAMELELW